MDVEADAVVTAGEQVVVNVADEPAQAAAQSPSVTIPDTPDGPGAVAANRRPIAVDDEVADEHDDGAGAGAGGYGPPVWAVALSNAALIAVDGLDRRDHVRKVAIEQTHALKEGRVTRRVELELLCATERIARMGVSCV